MANVTACLSLCEVGDTEKTAGVIATWAVLNCINH